MYFQFKSILTTLILSCLFFMGQAQNDYNQTGKVLETKAIKLGTTSPIKNLIPLGPISKEKKNQWKKENKIPRNFVGRGINKVVRPELEHQGADKLRQGIPASSTKMTDVNILLNYDGITNGSPNDPTCDVGENHFVLAINATEIAVYDKGGNEITTFTGNTLWQEIGFSSAGDPIVLYDQVANRWMISEFPSGNQLLIAISETSDPLGSYDVYNFQTPNFPDYPKYGIWDGAVVVTTNEQGSSNLTTYYLNKTQLYKGMEEVQMLRLNLPGNGNTEQGFFVTTPVNWIGQNSPKSIDPIFLNINDSSWGDVDEDQITVSTVDIDFDNPDNTTVSRIGIVTSPFDGYPCSATGFGFQCIPQGGNGGGLDGIPEVVMNVPVYRNFITHESMVLNFITDVTDGDNLSGIRWIELRREDADWYLYQEGTFSPDDGLDRFMGSISMDGSGNIALAYNVSSEDVFAGVRLTGRKWDDELGVMTIPEQIVVEGENTINSFGRFGDYPQMGVDPLNDKTFWYVTEYGKGPNSSSSTRIVAFEIDRDTVDIGAFRYNGPTSSGFEVDEPVSIIINNFGLEDVNEFEVGFIFDGGNPFVETVTQNIPAGGSIEYTFSETVDYAGPGEYTLSCFTNLEGDEVSANDTLNISLIAIARIDPAIGDVATNNSNTCEDTTYVAIDLFNNGSDTLKTANIEVELNGTIVYSELWSGNLPFCERESLTIPLTDYNPGENTITVSVSNPNNDVDQGLFNNEGFTTFTFIENPVNVFINFTFDIFPEETSWELLDLDGNVLLDGGPYPDENSAIELVCLDSTQCYEFIIYDSYGDGIFFPGTYTITNENGTVLASLMENDFGSQESNEFCPKFECMLEVDIAVIPAGNDGGTILLTPQNGVGPFMYSIDGGASFQDNGLFENVDAGNYNIVVTGAENCFYEEEVEVIECAMEVMVEFIHQSGANLGEITLLASGGTSPYEYSIDGGDTWESGFVFTDIVAGDYDVRVRDALGCLFISTVTIDNNVSIEKFKNGIVLLATPNPTTGVFNIHLEGNIVAGNFIEYEIYDATGKKIRTATLVKYDESYTAQVTLAHESAGTYYLKINLDKINKLTKIIKL